MASRVPDVAACPCASGHGYAACCGRLHRGDAVADSAAALMRSRYSAFVCGAHDYLLATWHASTRPAQLAADTLPTTWLGLEVVTTRQGGSEDDQGEVEFIARYKQQGRVLHLHETSRFVREDGRWWYVDGELRAQNSHAGPARNGPCPCGSGRKYKRCCAAR